MADKFYITTAIPYVNAKPHIGHALEFVQGDAIARYHKALGKDVLLLSGGDENALKNVQAAEKAGKPVQEFINENSQSFAELATALHVQFNVFQKGSDTTHHFPSSQQLWNLCAASGDIYKKSYEGLYCVGCEAFYTKDELNEKGECYEHSGKPLELIKEENYFFALSKYQDDIVRRLTSGEIKIYPDFRKTEILNFVKQGLQDISISRSNARAKNWGVPVPNDSSQRMYVWFDALNIYQSGIGFGWDEKTYSYWWPANLHVIGKGISRFHAVYWPAFLLSSNLALPKGIFIHGYFTINGQKMSKTLGNVIDPLQLINTYGAEPLRYYFLREIPAFSDGDFTESRLRELYTADLANGLGNLVSRIAKLATSLSFPYSPMSFESIQPEEYDEAMKDYRLHDAVASIWNIIKETDGYINKTEPWKQKGKELEKILTPCVHQVRTIAVLLQPFLPETAKRIMDQYNREDIVASSPLFPRLSS
jgi:methionyl-tRNA synthetase